MATNVFSPVRPDVEATLEQLRITFPGPPQPVAHHVNAVRSGNLIFLSGGGAQREDGTYITGKMGRDLNIAQGYEAARRVAIYQLAVLKAELGDLNMVSRIV